MNKVRNFPNIDAINRFVETENAVIMQVTPIVANYGVVESFIVLYYILIRLSISIFEIIR